MKKRLLSILLMCCMVLTLLPTAAFAAQEMAEKAVAIFRERYATIGLFENSVFPGVVELLQALRKKGKRLAVATSKKEDLAVRILEHFEIADYFEVIGGGGGGGGQERGRQGQ